MIDLGSVTQSEVSQKDINAYMWKLEKWYIYTYFQGRNRDADLREGTCGHSRGNVRWDELGAWD